MRKIGIVFILLLLLQTSSIYAGGSPPIKPPVSVAVTYDYKYDQVTMTWIQVSDANWYVVNKQDKNGVYSQVKDLQSNGPGNKRVIDYTPAISDTYSLAECYWGNGTINICIPVTSYLPITYPITETYTIKLPLVLR